MSEHEPAGPIEIDAGIGDVRLQQLTPADAQRYFDLIDFDRDHFNRVGEPTAEKYKTVEDVLESFNRTADRVRFGIWTDDALVGTISYEPVAENTVEVGYLVGKEYAGHGYAADAVRTIVPYLFAKGWRWVEAWAREDNVASRKTLLSAGLIEQGPDAKHDEGIKYELQNPAYS